MALLFRLVEAYYRYCGSTLVCVRSIRILSGAEHFMLTLIQITFPQLRPRTERSRRL